MPNTPQTQDPNAAPARSLEQAYEDYETALGDFDGKLAAFSAAQAALQASAQTVAGFKQELDALDQKEDDKFERVKPYLPAA